MVYIEGKNVPLPSIESLALGGEGDRKKIAHLLNCS